MSIPKRGARRIVVDGQEYRWQLRRRPTPDQRSGRTPLLLAVAARDSDGPAMLVRLHRPHPGNQVGLSSAAVTPREVAELVREGLRAGWRPARPGRQFVLEPRAAARGPQTWPRGQAPRSAEQLLELARGRESCDRLRLADAPAHVSWPGGGGFQPCAIVINDRDLIAHELAHAAQQDPRSVVGVIRGRSSSRWLSRRAALSRRLAFASPVLAGPDAAPGATPGAAAPAGGGACRRRHHAAVSPPRRTRAHSYGISWPEASARTGPSGCSSCCASC